MVNTNVDTDPDTPMVIIIMITVVSRIMTMIASMGAIATSTIGVSGMASVTATMGRSGKGTNPVGSFHILHSLNFFKTVLDKLNNSILSFSLSFFLFVPNYLISLIFFFLSFSLSLSLFH